MKLTRRGFLGLSLATGVLAGAGLWLRRFIRPAPLTSSEVKTLESYLDTLIPADDSPGAVELGVTDRLIQKAAVNKRYKKLIQKGCKWLDSEAQRQDGADFATSTETPKGRSHAPGRRGDGRPLSENLLRTDPRGRFHLFDDREFRDLKVPGRLGCRVKSHRFRKPIILPPSTR